MQTTLLGLAIALIAAILAAFAAPLFIDWNEWRPQLEAQASALAGTRVTIAGNIDLTLLPTPAFVLRDVSLGDSEKGSGLRAAEMRGSLALTALISGRVEADAFVLSRPSIRLVIEKDGTLQLPAGTGSGQEISVSGFVLEAGSLTIEDRRTNSLFAADDFSARGELVSREGPFRLDGGFRAQGLRWILRASSGRFGPDHTGKVRLAVERPGDQMTFEAEGALSLGLAPARFDGRVIAAQRAGTMPWRVSADASGDAFEIRLANLELALGQGELPITLSGEGKLNPRANGTIEATLTSKRIDLDLGDQKAGATGAAQVLPLLAEVQKLLGALPLPTQVALAADGVLAGGQLARDVRASLRVTNGVTALERFEARLPGRSSIALSGKTQAERFSGPLTFQAEDPQMFARWLLGAELSAHMRWTSQLRFSGTLNYARDEMAIDQIEAFIENTKVGGRLLLKHSREQKSLLQAELRSDGADFDLLLPALSRVRDFAGDLRFTLDLQAVNSRLLQKPLKSARVAVASLGEGFRLRSLAIEDLDGLSLQARHAGDRGDDIAFSLVASQASGVGAHLGYLSGSTDLGNIAAKYAASHLPLEVAGTLSPLKDGWRVLAKSGAASLALDLGERRDSRQAVGAVLRLPETEFAAKGELRFGADGQVEPELSLTFKSSDLRKAFLAAERASASVLPASGTASILRKENSFVIDKLVFDLAGSRGTGRLSFPIGETAPFTAALSLDRADASGLLALAMGRAKVSSVEFGTPLFTSFPGALKLDIGLLAVSERLALEKVSLQIRAGRFETIFDDFRAQLAGGKVSGSLRIADTIPRVLEINLNAEDVQLAPLFATKALRGNMRGSVSLGANGRSEDELLASLSGKGTLVLTNLEIERSDATAVGRVFASVTDAADEKKVEQALLAALDRASLKASRLEAPLVITNGILRTGSARAQAGNIEIALSGELNIPKRSADALLNIEVTGNSAVRPGAIVRWSGPVAAQERSVDAKALITAITLRAIERGPQPTNTNAPLEERPPLVKKKKSPAKSDIETAPLLPPPADVPSAPQPRSQN